MARRFRVFVSSTTCDLRSYREAAARLLREEKGLEAINEGTFATMGYRAVRRLLAQEEELRRLSQQIHFLKGKPRGQARRRKLYFQLLRRARRLRKRLLRDFEVVRGQVEGRTDLVPSRQLLAQEALGFLAEDLAALEQAANVCERRIMLEEKVPVAEKIISLSDADASFIVKGGWNRKFPICRGSRRIGACRAFSQHGSRANG